ncbi:MAG: DUF1214 domain-containing protein [Hyphomonadaceae bacterium]
MTDAKSASPASDAAWQAYRQALDDTRAQVLATEWVAEPRLRAQALYFLQMHQVTAFAKYLAPRPAFPHLHIHLEFLPFEITTGQSNPDFLYRYVYLDGARTYRLWGRKGTTRWTDFQVTNGFWGDERMETLGNYSIDAFEADADGRYEVILSATPHPGNWMRLDATSVNNMVLIRETWCDWENERGVEMLIECADRGRDDEIVYDEAEFNRRLNAAARYLRFSTNFSVNTTKRVVDAVGFNTFFDATAPKPGEKQVGGANAQAQYVFSVYRIARDEALIIEFEPPPAKYWGISLGDVWFASTDYSYHQSSLNDVQATRDADGKVRLVLALDDPGVPNWLDAVGTTTGIVILRGYLSERPFAPTTKLVKRDEVRAHLPTGTPAIDASTRAQALRRRTRASLKRYGF